MNSTQKIGLDSMVKIDFGRIFEGFTAKFRQKCKQSRGRHGFGQKCKQFRGRHVFVAK